MKRFAELYRLLDETTKTNLKLEAMVEYFRTVSPEDAAWAIFFLSGQKIRRMIPSGLIRQWATERAGIPNWLFEETYSWVGDLAETLSLIVPSSATTTEATLAYFIEEKLKPLSTIKEVTIGSEKSEASLEHPMDTLWNQVGPDERFVLMKLITGSFRVGVSKRLVTRALADAFGLPPDMIAHRLMGQWKPTPDFFLQLVAPESHDTEISRPYPFCLANPLEDRLESIGNCSDYLAEWKWDGIRAQLIRRNSQTFLWSRGEERLEDRFPEVTQYATHLPNGCVLDGELLAWHGNMPLPFAQLQRRIGRKTIGAKLLREVPVAFVAFDLLEFNQTDIRSQPLSVRRSHLKEILNQLNEMPSLTPGTNSQNNQSILESPPISANAWESLDAMRCRAREFAAEGLMLKHLGSIYETGRVRGTWWKWKLQPYSIDAVLIYAQRGHGRRASLYTDYTFALWDEGKLVPFAKAYSGLTDAEITKVDRFVRENTKDKFGPVRSVAPELVFELAFENIQISNRHKSGVAVRFPRIVRWRTDKKPADANTLSDLHAMASMGNTANEVDG